jgi:hypothetical protein
MLRIAIAVFLFLSAMPTHAAEIYAATSKDGLTSIFILGKLNVGDEVRFKNELLTLAKRGIRVTGVNVYSPGGSVYAAVKIGRYIRAIHLFGTWVPHEVLPFSYNMNVDFWNDYVQSNHCFMYDKKGEYVQVTYNRVTRRGNSNCVCASACFLIWAAGAGVNQQGSRGTEVPGALRMKLSILIHRPYFEASEYAKLPRIDARSQYEGTQKFVSDYLREMEVPDAIIRRMFSIPSNELSPLTREEVATMDARALWPPYLEELYIARCGKNEACQENFVREVYFEKIKELENMD